MAKTSPPQDTGLPLPLPKYPVVVMQKGFFSLGGIDIYTREELAYRDLPLWRRVWMRLRRRT